MGLAERSSYKVTDVAKAIAQQRISVRCIKLLMAHWLENEKHRFVKGVGCSHSIAEHRERAKTSGVFGLYEREVFLQSCRPRGVVDDLLTLLLVESLVDVLLRKAPAPSAATAVTVPEVSPAVSKDGEKEAIAKARRAKKRKEFRKRRAKRLAAAKVAKAASESGDGVDEVCAAKMVAATLAAVATTEDDQASESDDGETAPAAAASDGEDNVPVVVSSSQQDALAILEAAVLPTQGNLSLFSDGLLPRFGQDALTDTSPPAFTASPRRFRTPPSTPPRSPAKTPPSSPSEPWNIAWGGGVEAEYDDVLDQRDHGSLRRKFEDLKILIATEGMLGLRGLIKKIESLDDVFSYRLNDFYRAVFSADKKTKTITFIRGIEHYKGVF
jgi:hypothetical protein